ncbi:MAG: molybdopterin-dependent oxidoreductase [Acidobacteria bacterium]|nr:molybdopterin-dependent oxidoreductase [Acidobacteriota bacterium]MCI0621128.1 molybdopterin-dependent oxidoreductase [Acidobacteriota bacterium]MCI0723880.1 molybdopterin-dependent oxidoreductase [Acidobacteriota bacterium]
MATIEDGRITKIRGDKEHPITRGFLCYRTSLFLSTQYSQERLTSPLLRHNGEFHPISWEEALDLAADRLTMIRNESGPAAIFHYRSGGSLGLLKHLSDYFFERFGPVTTKRGDICSGGGDAAQTLDFGEEESHDIFDLLNAKNILLWGKNVFTSSPHTVPVLMDAKAKGAKLVLIDPAHHKTAALCERFIQPRPGSDFALAMAVARILFENNWIDPQAGSYCDHLDAFRGLAMCHSVENWCQGADVAPESAHDLARRLGPEKPTAILVGWGMGRRINGAGMVRALDALCAISGNIGISGGGVSFYFKRRGAFDTSFIRGKEAAPRTVCEPLFGPELLRLSDPPIRAVWVTAGNPVAMLPESETTIKALSSREFVVVVDSFLTDTARLAHLVLPTTTLLEADDLLGSYGHHWIGVARPVVAPPAGVKSDLEITQELADRVGLGEVMAGSPSDWKRRFIAPKLEPRGLTLETLEAGAARNPLPKKVLFADRKFPTATRRVNLMTEAPPSAGDNLEYPLFMMSLSTEKSQSSHWATPQEGPATVTVHPDAARDIADGSLCRMESAIGSMMVRLRHDARQRRDVAIIPKGGHYKDGRCANALLRARTTDLGEGGALYDERVRLVRI